MATDAGTAYIDVEERTDKLGRKLERDGPGIFSGIGRKLGLGLGVAMAVGIGGGIGLLKGAVEAAEESRKVMAQTEAVIKSTGGAARVSAKDVDALSTSLAAKTGIDDEVIASGQNLLLTFTKVRNEVGEGNDIFNQGTAAALDMSVALKTDLSSASMLVGKALNDPVKGMMALTRSGIQFTDQQKDQVKAMVAAGDTMGAQKIILAELNTQFAGSAEAAASPMARLKVALGNLQEQIGGFLLPFVGKAATGLTRLLINLAPWFEKIGAGVRGLVDLFVHGDFTGALAKAFGWQEDSPIVGILLSIREHLSGVVGFVRDHATPILIGLGATIMVAVVAPLLAWAAAQIAALAPFILIGAAIAGLVVGIIYAYNHFEAFRAIVQALGDVFRSAFDAIRAIVEVAVAVVMDLWDRFGSHLIDHIVTHLNAVMQVFSGVLNIVKGVFEVFAGIFTGDWSRVWGGIKSILSGILDAIVGIVKIAINYVSTVIGLGMALVSALWSAAWNALKSAVVAAIGGVLDVAYAIPGRILSALGNLAGLLYNAGVSLITGLLRGMVDKAREMLAWVSGLAGKIASLKGPLDYDRRLLTPAGEAIMQSLMDGLRNEEDRLVAQLSHITGLVSSVGGSASVGLTAGIVPGSAGTTNGTSGGFRDVVLNQVGNQDPVHIARALAWEMR